MRAVRTTLLAASGALFAACAGVVGPPSYPVPAGPPAGFPEEAYLRAAERNEPVFRVDPEHSRIIVNVYRGGTLARFGHDHVITSHDIHGYLRLPDESGRAEADLYVSLATFAVDDPRLRAQAGFDTQPSAQDIEGTRQHMLDSVLDVARHPFVTVHVARAQGEAPDTLLHAEVGLHGASRSLPVSVEMDQTVAGLLTASGHFSVDQTDFGMTPYSVLGGALQVLNRIDVHFRIQARRIPSGRGASSRP